MDSSIFSHKKFRSSSQDDPSAAPRSQGSRGVLETKTPSLVSLRESYLNEKRCNLRNSQLTVCYFTPIYSNNVLNLSTLDSLDVEYISVAVENMLTLMLQLFWESIFSMLNISMGDHEAQIWESHKKCRLGSWQTLRIQLPFRSSPLLEKKTRQPGEGSRLLGVSVSKNAVCLKYPKITMLVMSTPD